MLTEEVRRHLLNWLPFSRDEAVTVEHLLRVLPSGLTRHQVCYALGMLRRWNRVLRVQGWAKGQRCGPKQSRWYQVTRRAA